MQASVLGLARRHASYGANSRTWVTCANWKANGNHAQVQQWLQTLNSGTVAPSSEVIIAPPFPYISEVKGRLRKDFSVASQVRAARCVARGRRCGRAPSPPRAPTTSSSLPPRRLPWSGRVP